MSSANVASRSASGRGTCPNCGSTHIEQHDASGASVCTECGVVLEENAIVSAVEFVEGAGGASSMVGQFVSATSSKAYTSSQGVGGRGGYGFSRDSRETTLANGRRRITEVASRLRLGGHYVDAAHRLFTIAVEKNFVQGRRTIHVVAACLYIACRQEKSQHMLIDFSDALQVNVYTLGTCFLKFRRLLGLKLEILDPALYVYRFAAHLELEDKANAVALTALRLVGRMKRDWIVAGRRPAGICAAALLIAARAHGFSRQPQDVTRILRVCGMTVTTRVKEFELTPSASLTLDQFNRVELETEADPPIFTKNRIMEARARAIQENNVALLESGALDNPMDSKKRAIKWRDGKTKKKELDFEELYQTIEKDLLDSEEKEAVEGEEENDDSGELPQGDTLGEKDTEESEAAAREKLTHDDEEDEDPGKDTATMGKEADSKDGESEQPLSILKKGKGTKTTGLEVSKTVTIANNELLEIPKQWEKAYPKSSWGKAIVLPNQSIPEERQPSTIPNEGILDTKTWKDSMPQDMADDFESIFRDPTEIAQKEAIFNKINKDYIELQAQKDKIRVSTEEAENQDERDLAEQAQGQERYRKRKNRGRDTAETTEEALLQAVANRKISRKINYDAMSAIFDDAGSFSTSEAAAGGGAEEEALMPEF
jgi:transcription initiation factor TFIIIB Brf1 subunit/transcription initiation factor TFIIB